MEMCGYIVKKEFGKLIDVNALLDDFVYYISVCTDIDIIDARDDQEYYYNKALECLNKWVQYNTFLPKHTLQTVAESLKQLAETTLELSKNSEECDIELTETIRAIYDLAEFAKIVSVILHWEKVREKYQDVSIDCTTA